MSEPLPGQTSCFCHEVLGLKVFGRERPGEWLMCCCPDCRSSVGWRWNTRTQTVDRYAVESGGQTVEEPA